MNPAGQLEGFQGRLGYFYNDVQQAIIGELLFYPYDDLAKSIINKLGYYHVRSDDKFNFYLPGYLEGGSWCNKHKEFVFNIEGKPIEFCTEWFVEFLKFFENKMIDYHYSAKPELLLFNAYNGEIDFTSKIQFKIKELVNSSFDFDDVFEEINKAITKLNKKSLNGLRITFGKKVTKKLF